MIKKIMPIVLSLFAFAFVFVGGYFRKNGTYVSSYYRTSPNSYKFDNYSSYGNYNPFSGKRGYVKYNYWSW